MGQVQVVVRRAEGEARITRDLTPQLDRWKVTTAADVERAWKQLTPVLTGNLRRSIRTRSIAGGFAVFTDVEYAIFVELGTRFMPARMPAARAVEVVTPRAGQQLRSIVASLPT